MSGNRAEKDARKRELARLLHERRWRSAELAERFEVDPKTIQRDLKEFAAVLRHPVPRAGGAYFLEPGMQPVPPPISLNRHEARALLFAARLLLRNTDEQDPAAVSALGKIAAAFPGIIGDYIGITVRQLQARPANADHAGILRRVTDAWELQRTLEIRYARPGGRPRTFRVDPYLLEPNPTSAASYLVGFCHEAGNVGVFAIDRMRRAEILNARFETPALDSLAERMGMSWTGTVLQDHDVEVVIDFTPAVAQRVSETYWHPARRFEELDDGGLRLCARLSSLLGVAAWVRTWGADAIVIAPPELRVEVAGSLETAAARYR